MTEAKRMSADEEAKTLIAQLRCDCHCEDNVDAEREYDGSWRGSFSICTSCKAADALSKLSAELEAARATALEEAAKNVEATRVFKPGANTDDMLADIPKMDCYLRGFIRAQAQLAGEIRALKDQKP